MKIQIAKRTADKAWLEEEGALPVTVQPRSAQENAYSNSFQPGPEANTRR
jgi:hypothetical protein